MDGWMDGWRDGWTDGEMDGWMEEIVSDPSMSLASVEFQN